MGDWRSVQVAVYLNGAPLPGVIGAEVEANAYRAADRFTAHIAYQAIDPAVLSVPPLTVQIDVSVDGVWQSLITGQADSLEIDPVQGVLGIRGRDLTALFISSQISETFQNQTASAVASLLAARHGLTANVAPTQPTIGRYYQSGRTSSAFSQHARATTEWDLLTLLADQAGFDVWVSGTTLNFQPFTQPAPAMTVTPQSCMSMRLHRAMDLAAGIGVTVKSWNSVGGTSVVGTASSQASGPSGLSLTGLQPNLSQQDANQLAQRAVADISIHEREISFDLPGEPTLMPRMGLALAATGTDFDGTYQVMEVERRISADFGFVETVVARGLPWTAS